MAISSGPAIDVAVTFNPPNEIICEPEHVRVHTGKNETVNWRLSSSDKSAALQDIEFTSGDPKGPFPEMRQHPDDPTLWEGRAVDREAKGTFKYDIVVRDKDGNDVRLDPRITLGDPPG